ncbi:MAG: energy-coupling factor transporter ATPase [Coriobacteriia bacterium]|nr:energy-coupling factor transporter ATPase [Coriobacteriia bacterium]
MSIEMMSGTSLDKATPLKHPEDGQMLSFTSIGFSYPDSAKPALDDVSFQVLPGRYTVLLGANGSGKSTLARLANGLLEPTSGRVTADGIDSRDTDTLWELRQRVGLVSQDPDEQIVSSTVLDEVAFGPENLGIEPGQIALRVEQSLAAVGLSNLSDRDPNTLSGGQKQLLVLAGILSMQPQYLVLDEPTSMLDEPSRKEFVKTVRSLRAAGHGILHITHDLELVGDADEAIVLSEGRMVYRGDPQQLLADYTSLNEWKLAVPLEEPALKDHSATPAAGQSLYLDKVHFGYSSYPEPPVSVLTGLSLALQPGTYTLISGASGAGKSTLLRVATGLLKPDQGTVAFVWPDTDAPDTLVPVAPGQVGLVFQHPEDQLFATTVAEDILFGPKNLGLLEGFGTKRQAPQAKDSLEGVYEDEDELVAWALESVGLDFQSFKDRSPFALSGGEMRRVAIAGVLAMQPKWLLFDEPTAGIDAMGRAFMHKIINDQLARDTAVLVVSHSIEEFATRVERHYRLEGGKLWPM